MKRILITGATGNVGREVIDFLYKSNNTDYILRAGLRNLEAVSSIFSKIENIELVQFDFEDPGTFQTALQQVDCVFFLRPPQLSSVDKYFKPFIQSIKDAGVKQVIFLSVQGADKSSIIPHNKIEKLIKESGIDFIFLRPGYFMQNITTTLFTDIRVKRKIILPAGNAVFNWIDVKNIGEVVSLLIQKFDTYKNRAIDLTGNENLSFQEVVNEMNLHLAKPVSYKSTSLFNFFLTKRKDKIATGMIMVMMMLHYIPRFQAPPLISNLYKELTGKNPTTVKEFIIREKSKLD